MKKDNEVSLNLMFNDYRHTCDDLHIIRASKRVSTEGPVFYKYYDCILDSKKIDLEMIEALKKRQDIKVTGRMRQSSSSNPDNVVLVSEVIALDRMRHFFAAPMNINTLTKPS